VLVERTPGRHPLVPGVPGRHHRADREGGGDPDVQEALQDAGHQIPSWLSREGTQPIGRVISEPNPEELDIPVDIELIIAFYAR